MTTDISSFISNAALWALPVLIAITLHEAAHAYAAYALGDDTAYREGRMSLNPLKHVDPMGTILVPGVLLLTGAPFLFGWAKPVPVQFARLNNPRRDMVFVAAAGPASNLIIATISALLINLAVVMSLGASSQWLVDMLSNSIIMNLVIAVFNMMPLPPLDGGRIAVGLLPRSLALPLARLEPYGFLILIGGLFILPLIGDKLGMQLDIFRWLIREPIKWMLPFFEKLANLI